MELKTMSGKQFNDLGLKMGDRITVYGSIQIGLTLETLNNCVAMGTKFIIVSIMGTGILHVKDYSFNDYIVTLSYDCNVTIDEQKVKDAGELKIGDKVIVNGPVYSPSPLVRMDSILSLLDKPATIIGIHSTYFSIVTYDRQQYYVSRINNIMTTIEKVDDSEVILHGDIVWILKLYDTTNRTIKKGIVSEIIGGKYTIIYDDTAVYCDRSEIQKVIRKNKTKFSAKKMVVPKMSDRKVLLTSDNYLDIIGHEYDIHEDNWKLLSEKYNLGYSFINKFMDKLDLPIIAKRYVDGEIMSAISLVRFSGEFLDHVHVIRNHKRYAGKILQYRTQKIAEANGIGNGKSLSSILFVLLESNYKEYVGDLENNPYLTDEHWEVISEYYDMGISFIKKFINKLHLDIISKRIVYGIGISYDRMVPVEIKNLIKKWTIIRDGEMKKYREDIEKIRNILFTPTCDRLRTTLIDSSNYKQFFGDVLSNYLMTDEEWEIISRYYKLSGDFMIIAEKYLKFDIIAKRMRTNELLVYGGYNYPIALENELNKYDKKASDELNKRLKQIPYNSILGMSFPIFSRTRPHPFRPSIKCVGVGKSGSEDIQSLLKDDDVKMESLIFPTSYISYHKNDCLLSQALNESFEKHRKDLQSLSDELIVIRKEIKKVMSKYPKDSETFKSLSKYQNKIKKEINSLYQQIHNPIRG